MSLKWPKQSLTFLLVFYFILFYNSDQGVVMEIMAGNGIMVTLCLARCQLTEYCLKNLQSSKCALANHFFMPSLSVIVHPPFLQPDCWNFSFSSTQLDWKSVLDNLIILAKHYRGKLFKKADKRSKLEQFLPANTHITHLLCMESFVFRFQWMTQIGFVTLMSTVLFDLSEQQDLPAHSERLMLHREG